MTPQFYLWFNCILYAGFAGWCLLKPTATATFSGLSFLNTSGRAEYFAVYVGMEAGWAVFYLVCAMQEELNYAGILFSVCMYAGIVVFRWVSILQKGAVSKNSYYIAFLEIVLLAWAVLLLLQF